MSEFPSQPNSEQLMPYAYGYQYHDCVRFNGGGEVNGARPIKAIPLFDEKAIASLKARIEELEGVLRGMVDMYVALVESGDAGFWDPEKVDEVIAARKALEAKHE